MRPRKRLVSHWKMAVGGTAPLSHSMLTKKSLIILGGIILLAGVAGYVILTQRVLRDDTRSPSQLLQLQDTSQEKSITDQKVGTERLNYREGSRPRDPQFQFVPEGLLITWQEPELRAEVDTYIIATGGGILYRDSGETKQIRYLIPFAPDQSICNLSVRITPVDHQGALMLPAHIVAIERKVNPNDCGPQL